MCVSVVVWWYGGVILWWFCGEMMSVFTSAGVTIAVNIRALDVTISHQPSICEFRGSITKEPRF